MIFAGGKIMSARKTKSQPADINNAENARAESPAPNPVTPEAKDDTPDWLKNNESPFGSEDILSQEVSQTQTNTDTHTPDWMNDHHEEQTPATPATPTTEEKSAPEVPTTQTTDVPDWLKEEKTPTTDIPVTPQVETNTTIIQEEIPEWLRSTETETSAAETIPVTENPITESTGGKAILSEAPISGSSNEDDIPDWLKGAQEESTPPVTTETPQKEETIEQTAPAETPVPMP